MNFSSRGVCVYTFIDAFARTQRRRKSGSGIG
jgi:hypothetical protein